MKVINKENPLSSISVAVAFCPHDFSNHHRLAWIYGITCGWDDVLDKIAEKHKWDKQTVARLKRLRERWEALEIEVDRKDHEAEKKKEGK